MKKLLSLTLALAMTLSLAMPVVAEGLPEDTAAQQEVVQEVADDAPVETPEPTEPTEPTEPAEPTEQPTEAPTAEPVETPTETPTEPVEPTEEPAPTELPTENGEAKQYDLTVYDGIYYTLFSDGTAAIDKTKKDIAGAVVLPAEIEGHTLVTIGVFAFQGRSNITSVSIPDTVKQIQTGAFSSCTALESVNLPENLEVLGERAFDNCTSLKQIAIPGSVQGIAPSTFHSCKTLTEVSIGTGVTEIDRNAFSYCENLTSINIPDGVSFIGECAFIDCTKLEKIELPDSVVQIGEDAFNGTGIKEMKIPNGVTEIKDLTFNNCTNLEKVSIPDHLTSIGVNAFSSTKITKIDLPATLTNIGAWAFQSGQLEKVIIPDGVTTIGNGAFSYNQIKELVIPDSVTNIGDYVFTSNQIEELTIPDKVTNIGRSAFSSNGNIKSLIIPDSVTTIGDHAFSNCWALEKIKLSQNLTSVGEGAFSGTGINSITIPESMTEIPEEMFDYCLYLQHIAIPKSVTSIGNNALVYYPNAFGHGEENKNKVSVYYVGSKEDKEKLTIGSGNSYLDNATWFFNSIGKDMTPTPSAGVKEPVVGTVTAEKGKVSILVRDEEGQPIKGAELTQPGVDASIRRTDEKGMASLPYNYGERFYAVASATGYYNAAVKVDNIIDGEMRVITMKKFDANSYVCTSVVITDPVAGEDETYDVLTPGNPVVIFADDDSPESRTIIPEFQVADGAEPIAKVVLYQGTKKIGWSKSDWKIETKFKQYCEPGRPLYLVAYDEYDMELLRVPLQISVQNYNAVLQNYTLGGSGVSFTVSEDIPILGGTKVEFNPKMSLPIELRVIEGGTKVRVYVNCNDMEVGSLNDKIGSATDSVEKCLKSLLDEKLEAHGKGDIKNLFGFSANITACGVGEATVSPGSNTMIVNVKIMLGISVGGKFMYNVMLVPIPVYVEIGANGSATGIYTVNALKLTPLTQNGVSYQGKASGALDLNFGLSAALGAGFKNGLATLAAEGEVQGNMDVFWAMPSNNWTVDATLRADIIAMAGPCKATFKLKEETFPIYDSSWNKTASTSNNAWATATAKMYDASSYTMLERTYAINVDAQANGTELTQAGVYPYTIPRLAEYKGQKYLFYLDDATERGDADRTVLCYRVETSTGWSDPVRVQDDGTGDYDYALMTTDDGIYVAWQNTKKAFGANIDDLTVWQKVVGLTVAKVSGTDVEIIGNLDTSEEIEPKAPSLVSDNGKIIAVWTENNQNALDSNGINTIYAQQLNGERTACAALDKPIVYLQAGKLNGKFTIAWTEDTDSDLTTVSDCDIFLYQDGTITRVTNNEVNDGNPQFLQINGGKLIWYSDKSIVQLDDVGAEPKTILEQSSQCAENYRVSASNGRAVLTTVNSFTLSDANTSTLYTSVFDGANWSTPTLSLMTDSSLGSMDVLCDSNGNPKLAYTLTEGNQTDLYAAAPKNPGIVQIRQIDTKMSDYMPNQAMPIKVTLVNKGNGTGNVTARFVNADGTSVWQQDLGTIGADASKEFALENVILPAGDYTLEVCTDNVVTAKSEISLGKTDLSLGTNEYYSNGEKLLDIVAKNNSNIPAEATLKITEVGNPDNVLFEDSIGTLGAKESKPYIVNLTKMFADAGDIYGLEVSVSTEQEETTLENNMQTFYNVDKIDDIPGVTLNKTNLSMYPNKVVQLTAETSGVADEIQWSSNNEACATVDNTGKVTAIAPGNATVTCTYGTATAQCYITVKDATGVITSGSYTIDEDAGTLTGFAPGTTPAQIRTTLNDQSVTFEKVNGEEAPEDKPIGTGCTVTNGNQTLTLLLYGDVDGDGAIKMMDLVAIRKHIMRVKLLEGIYLRAAAPSNPDAETPKPSIPDMVRVRKYIMHVSDSVR